ncbi:MAG: hypothetical protein IPJ89_01990 [Candidatus Iainarchaeum archaeon]|uniref:Uncharacterized protein n=1 Tax=Candidatus Iainarchaeum sp. TaxID=3101447 RepID=A0A7T9DKG9_9ARCH|nr:MAG: hypothetical protein IPJ89_01990 [Candidatus Diapherotrites archaeon]
MVNEELVRNTIQKMRDAGLSEGIIQSTLADLGLTPQQVQAYLVGGTSAPTTPPPSAPPRSFSANNAAPSTPALDPADHEAIASLTNEKIQMGLMQNQAQRMDENALKDNITHLALEQHGQQLMDTHQSVMELHDKFDAANMQALVTKVNTIQARMENVSKDTQELRALASALQNLMQKILETNQQLVFELKKR